MWVVIRIPLPVIWAAVINIPRGGSLGNVAILVDNMYLQELARAYSVPKIDLLKFSENLLEKDEKRYRTYVFDALPYVPENGATQDQIDRKDGKRRYLDRLMYMDRMSVELGEVRPKPTNCRACGATFSVPVQKLVDVKLSVKLASLAWSKNVDKIILVTGDKDILPAVKESEDSGTVIRLVYGEVPEHNVFTSKTLIKECHEKRKLERQDLEYCRYIDPS